MKYFAKIFVFAITASYYTPHFSDWKRFWFYGEKCFKYRGEKELHGLHSYALAIV